MDPNLPQAVSQGNVRRLKEQGMDRNLYQAVSQGNAQRLKELTDKDPKLLLSKTPHGNTALHIATNLGHEEVVKEIISRDNTLLVMPNKDDDTPLHLAVRTKTITVALLLIDFAKNWPAGIESGEPFRMINKHGNTALHEAVWSNNIQIVKELLKADSGVMQMLNEKHESPLHIAAREGRLEIVEEFLKLDFVVSAEKLKTGTPLHQAVLGGHINIVEKLLDKKPDLIDMCDSRENTALHSAAQKNYSRIVDLLLKKNLMLAYSKNQEEKSPLLVATAHGSNLAINEILKHCPDASEQVDDKGRNALHVAVYSRTVGSLKCLLSCIQSEDIVNKPDENGNTPLHLAAKLSRIQSALLLLKDKRVNPHLMNRDGETARTLVEKLEDMDTYEVYIWKKLKDRETKRFSKQKFPETTQSRSFRRKVTPSDEQFKSSATTYTLVAALIATVTFAATFTMPGGYEQNTGKPLLRDHASFKVFIIMNTIAMCSSLVVVFCFIWAWKDPVQFKLKQLTWGHRLTVVACLAMLVALTTAVFVTISEECKWLAIVVILICCSAPFIVWAILGNDVLFIPVPI